MFKSFFIVLLALCSVAATAQTIHIPMQLSYLNQDGEYLSVETRDFDSVRSAYREVTAVVQAAGYKPASPGVEIVPPTGTRTDTWCKVDVYHERKIRVECYTPHQGLGVSVRDDLRWTQQEFKGDYSGVPVMISKIRDAQRRAAAALNIKS